MASKLISVTILVAVGISVSILLALCGIGRHSGPAGGKADVTTTKVTATNVTATNVTAKFDPHIVYILNIEPSTLEKMVRVDDADTAKLYADLADCYNGTRIEKHCSEAFYQFCKAHKDQLLDSYYANLASGLGLSLLAPIEFLKGFKQFAQWPENTTNHPNVNLRDYSGIWQSFSKVIKFTDSCEHMIKLVDVGFGQWGYDNKAVTDFFEQRLNQPVGEALELCRERVMISHLGIIDYISVAVSSQEQQ